LKLTKFSDTHVFNAPVQGFALEFYNTFGNLAKKNENDALPNDDILYDHVGTIPAFYGQTDRNSYTILRCAS